MPCRSEQHVSCASDQMSFNYSAVAMAFLFFIYSFVRLPGRLKLTSEIFFIVFPDLVGFTFSPTSFHTVEKTK